LWSFQWADVLEFGGLDFGNLSFYFIVLCKDCRDSKDAVKIPQE